MNLRTLAAFVIGLAAAGTVSAQSVTLKAKIPFNFMVNGKSLPAGEYTVRQANSAAAMMIQGVEEGVGTVTLVSPASAPGSRQGTARLVFNHYGDRYFLAQIWASGAQGSEVPQTRSERELVAQRNHPKPVVVAAVR